MSFTPKSGCPMCGIVSQAQRERNVLSPASSPPSSPSPSLSTSSRPEFLWHDTNFTIYRENTNPVSSKGHIIVAFNLHVPSIYTLSSSDLPLLTFIREMATKLLNSLVPVQSPSSPTPTASVALTGHADVRPSNFCIGFITPPFRDPRIPVTDHLHAHAFIGPADQAGWFRGIAYSSLAWYDIDDLIAEIRESVSNNRIKSGYEGRKNAPINLVPDAGARTGTANGLETTEVSIASSDDIEDGQRRFDGSRDSHIILSSPPHGRTQV